MKTASLAIVAAIFPAFVATATLAETPTEAPITISDAAARSANVMSGAAVMTLTNTGSEDCTLTAATGDVAEKIELHTHENVDGVMKMTAIPDGITIPAGGDYQLEPSGDHIMLMGLTAPLEPGDSIDLVLDFGPCGVVPVEIPVVALSSEDAAGMDHADHGDHETVHDHDATHDDDGLGHDHDGEHEGEAAPAE